MAATHKESDRKEASNFKSTPEEEIRQLVVTIDPAMGGIVKVAKIDKAGQHEELSEEECATLVGEDEVEEIQDAIEEAFEAAVLSTIGAEDQAESDIDDEDERAIRRFLINDLFIPRAIRRRFLHRLLLSRMLRRRFLNTQQRQGTRSFRQGSTGPRAIPFDRSNRISKRK